MQAYISKPVPNSLCRVLLGVCFAVGLVIRASATAPTDLQLLAEANSQFAFNLMQQVYDEAPGGNILLCPSGASSVLQMAATGAVGATAAEMNKTLCVGGLSPTSVLNGNRANTVLLNYKHSNFSLTVANSFWYRNGMAVSPGFIESDRQFFNANVQDLDFNSPSAVGAMNGWLSHLTQGRIQKFISGPIPANMYLYMLNAAYFIGNWEQPFDSNNTVSAPFDLDGGGQSAATVMQETNTFPYASKNGFQIVGLPYQGGDLTMYLVLPESGTLTKSLSKLNGAWWRQVMQGGLPAKYGKVALPKFTINSATDLEPPLQSMGMQTAFTKQADFSFISPRQITISTIQQEAVVGVNEMGTETSSSSATPAAAKKGVKPTFEFIANHPFMFVIQDAQTATIVFMGAVFNPS